MNPTVTLAQQGNQDAFADLYREHKPFISNLCFRLGKPEDTEDLTQEVFLHLYKNLHKFEGRSAFRTWLYRLATNVIFMARRRQRKLPIDNTHEWDFDKFLAGQQPNIDLRIDLERHIANLTPMQREAFVASNVYGFTHAEVASQQNTGLRAVKTRSHRARVKVRAAVCGL